MASSCSPGVMAAGWDKHDENRNLVSIYGLQHVCPPLLFPPFFFFFFFKYKENLLFLGNRIVAKHKDFHVQNRILRLFWIVLYE